MVGYVGAKQRQYSLCRKGKDLLHVNVTRTKPSQVKYRVARGVCTVTEAGMVHEWCDTFRKYQDKTYNGKYVCDIYRYIYIYVFR